MAITPLPTPPSRADSANFAERGDTFMAALPTFATEANALATEANAAATTATTKAGEAAASASGASSSATSAANSASSASASAASAANSLDSFDDRYLGAKSSDPTLNNDGDALAVGALYLNTSNSVMRVWLGASWQNVASTSSGDLSGPASSTDNTIPRFDGTTGKLLQGSGVVVDDSGNLSLGTAGSPAAGRARIAAVSSDVQIQLERTGTATGSGFVGASSAHSFTVYPGDLSKSHQFSVAQGAPSDAVLVDSNGNLLVNTTSPNASWGRQVRIADANYPALSIISTAATNGREYTFGLNGTTTGPSYLELWDQSNARSILQISADDSTTTFRRGAFGYGAGAGGTVVQPTSKSTTVTLNKPNGLIQLNGAALAAGASIGFQLNNSVLHQNDSVILNLWGTTATLDTYRVFVDRVEAGYAWIVIQNYSGVSRSEAFTIHFAVIKGSST